MKTCVNFSGDEFSESVATRIKNYLGDSTGICLKLGCCTCCGVILAVVLAIVFPFETDKPQPGKVRNVLHDYDDC